METFGKYILEHHTPVPANDLERWALWFETADRRVALDEIGGITISTVFLGIDHRHGMDGPPLLFETMTFTGDESGDVCLRCSTWDEAVAQHEAVVKKLQESCND